MANDLVMKIIMNAEDKASAAMQRVRNASHTLSGSLNDLEKELKDVANAQKMLEKHSNLRGKMAENAAALDKVRQRQKALTQEVRAAGGATAKHKEEFAKLGREAERLQEKQNKNRLALKALTAELKQAGVQVGNLKTAQAGLISRHEQAAAAAEKQRAAVERLAKAQARVAQAERRVESAESWNGKLQTVGTAAAMGATGIGVGMGLTVREYAKAESAAMELRVAMMNNKGQIAAEFEKVNNLATKLGNTLPGTGADFQNLMTVLVRQGISAKAILGGVGEAAALLAVQLKKPPAEAAEMTAKLQDALRATESEMLGIMDTVQRMYYVGVDDNNILGAFGKMSSALGIMKIQGTNAMKMLGPFIAMLDQSGLSGDSAGNALSKIFSAMMNPENIQKKLDEVRGDGVAKDFDLRFHNDKGEFAGMDNMFTQLEKLKPLDTITRLAILEGVFGKDAENTQALMAIIDKGRAGYEEMAAKMEAQASLQQRVNETLGTVANLWDSATGSFTNFLVAMGEAIAPEIRQAVEWIDIVSTKLGAWAKANPETANTILKLAAGIGIALAAFMALAGVVGAVILPMAMMSWSWAQLALTFSRGVGILGSVATALRTLGTAMLAFGRTAMTFLFTNPFGWAILAVGALYLLWRNWDKVKNALVMGWNYIKQVFRGNPFLGAFAGPIGMMLSLAANWDRVKAALIVGWQSISTRFANNPIVRFTVQSIGAVRTFAAIFGGIPHIVGAVMSAAGAYLGNAIASMLARIRSFNPSAAFQAAFSAALAYLRGLGGQMMAAGAAMIDGLINGIKSRIGAVSGYLSQLRGMVSNFRMPSLPSVSSVKSAMGFSRGGYTGAGGVNEAAGVVHKGEVVFSQRDVARFGGWQVVDRLRTGGLSALEKISGSLKIGNSLGEDNRPKLSGAMPRPKSFAPGFVGGNSGSLNMAGDSITINIHAAPNMDVRQLADLVMQKLNKQQRKQQTRANSRFFDKD